MAVKIVLSEHDNRWQDGQEDAVVAVTDFTNNLGEEELRFAVKDTNHGIGADWATVTVEIILAAYAAYVGVPEAYKRLKESYSGWQNMISDFRRVVQRFRQKYLIMSYSMDYTFLECLHYLSSKTDVGELSVISAVEIAGPQATSERDKFDDTPSFYYVFILRDEERAFIVTYDNRLRMISCNILGLDHRWAEEIEELIITDRKQISLNAAQQTSEPDANIASVR